MRAPNSSEIESSASPHLQPPPQSRAARFVILSFSSGFGAGYMPVAPGTFGTLVALPMWWALASLQWWTFLLVTACATAFAVWIAARAEAIHGEHDVGGIVIDEIVGLLATVIGVPFAWPQVLAAFLVFRVLDMWKPFPIRWIDHHVSGGFGVVMDDVVAGLVGCVLLHAARWVLGGWW